ncbi:MAG: GxxExxY protein [Proteobacteria bacterium]|nr:GxxExxY protein [Pseudomonadota bacterium]
MLDTVEIERLARTAVDCGYRLHCDLGPGLLESVYEALLTEYLRERGLVVDRQVRVPIIYNGKALDEAFRADIVVERKLLIELKSVERISPVHPKQVLTYLRLMGLPLGLLMNFGQGTFKDGLKRIANGYYGTIG